MDGVDAALIRVGRQGNGLPTRIEAFRQVACELLGASCVDALSTDARPLLGQIVPGANDERLHLRARRSP